MMLTTHSAYRYLASICRCAATSLRSLTVLLVVIGVISCAAGHAQTAHFSGAQFRLGGGFDQPKGVAVDSSGNVYVADAFQGKVIKIPVGCSSNVCTVQLGVGYPFSSPTGIAVDASGYVYVTDTTTSAVVMMTPGCTVSACAASTTACGGGRRVVPATTTSMTLTATSGAVHHSVTLNLTIQ